MFGIQSRTDAKARIRRQEHDLTKCPGPSHSSACYTTITDKQEVTRFFGVEVLPEGTFKATPYFDQEEDIIEPSEQEKGDEIGTSTLIGMLDSLQRRRSLVDPVKSPQAVTKLDMAISKVEGMIR